MTNITDQEVKKLFLIDAYALIYRSYFAFIRNPRFNSKGMNTSAMLGFANTLVQLLENEKPEYIGVVFDMSKPTFRHEMFPEYKANRQEMPEELRKAIPYIRKMIEGFRIPIIEKEGYEADDIIGTLAVKAAEKGFQTFMMTPDKDYAQLVNDAVFMYKPGKSGNDHEIWGVEEVKKNFELESPRLVLLDSIEDPHNVGAIMRTAEALGWGDVLLPRRGSPLILPSVAKASAGACEYLRIAVNCSANQYMKIAQEAGYAVAALDGSGKVSLEDVRAAAPAKLLLVVGGEDSGVSQFIINNAEYVVAIAQKGRINSLNASVAAGLALYVLG